MCSLGLLGNIHPRSASVLSPTQTRFLCDHLSRIDKWLILGNKEAARMVIDAILLILTTMKLYMTSQRSRTIGRRLGANASLRLQRRVWSCAFKSIVYRITPSLFK